MFYREVKPLHGSAPSQQVLLLHGQAFTSENWENLGTLSLLGALGHRAIAVDLPGSVERTHLALSLSPSLLLFSLHSPSSPSILLSSSFLSSPSSLSPSFSLSSLSLPPSLSPLSCRLWQVPLLQSRQRWLHSSCLHPGANRGAQTGHPGHNQPFNERHVLPALPHLPPGQGQRLRARSTWVHGAV